MWHCRGCTWRTSPPARWLRRCRSRWVRRPRGCRRRGPRCQALSGDRGRGARIEAELAQGATAAQGPRVGAVARAGRRRRGVGVLGGAGTSLALKMASPTTVKHRDAAAAQGSRPSYARTLNSRPSRTSATYPARMTKSPNGSPAWRSFA